MANVGYSIPVDAVLVGSVFLGENIGPEKIFAMALFITIVIVSQRFTPGFRRRQLKKGV